MRKLFLLPLLATAALVSQAWGAWASCATALGNTFYCRWATGCYEINKGATDSDDCQTKFDECKKDGTLYINVPSTGVGDDKECQGGTVSDLNTPVLGCCYWSQTGECHTIKDAPDELGQTGTQQVGFCKTGSNKFWSSACPSDLVCPTTTPDWPVSLSSSSGGSSSNSGSSSSVAPSSSSGGSSSNSGSSSSVTTSSSSGGSNSSSSGGSSSNSGSSSSVEGSSSSAAGGSSSSSDDPSPITNRSTLVASQSQANYYSLKGEPLGTAKPQKAGVYIVKQQGAPIKKIVIR